MKNILLFSLSTLCLLFALQIEAQEIYGFVKKSSGGALVGADVFVSNIGEATTDSNGRYSIDLSACTYCRAGTSVTVSINSDYGFKQVDYVIPASNKPFNISVDRNNKLILKGTVKDRQTKQFIEGIKVSAIITDFDIEVPPVITDDRGYFQFIIRKSGISSKQVIELIFIDIDNGKYEDKEEKVLTGEKKAISIELEECVDCGSRTNLKVSTSFRSNVLVEPGDIITIKASGMMRVGSFVGTSGPGGLPNNRGVLGVSLASYNYFKDWNHAVLIYRFGEEDEWKFYDEGKENKYLAQYAGYIEFAINDNKQADNSGAYDVEVIVRK